MDRELISFAIKNFTLMNRFYTALVLLLISFNSNAQFTSVANGDWNNCNTWETCALPLADRIPDAGDNVTIKDGYDVTATGLTISIDSLTITVNSSLTLDNTSFTTSGNLDLGNNTDFTLGGGSEVNIGGNLVYQSNGSNIDVQGSTGGGTLNIAGCAQNPNGTLRDPTGGNPVDQTNLSFCSSCPSGTQYGAGCGNITQPPGCTIPTIPVEPNCPSVAAGYKEMKVTGGTDQENISSNDGQYFIDAGGTLEQINVSGIRNTLIICNDVTIDQLSISGDMDIFIKSGATVTFATGLSINNGINLINYGTVIFDVAAVNLSGAKAISFVNAAANSILDFNNQLQINGTNAKFYSVASSTIEINTLDINPNLNEDIFVLGDKAILDVNNFNSNNQTNPVCATSSCALVNINTVGNGFVKDLSNQAAVSVCSVNGSANLDPGLATVTPTCPAICNTKLPITLISFEAIKKENAVELKWQTAAEFNNNYFAVERSSNGFDFSEIERVEGAGSYVGLLSYHTVDAAPLAGQSYYRLKQVDFDGKFTYSKVVSLFTTAQTSAFQVYPNPVTKSENLNINFNQQSSGVVSYAVYDVLGRNILTENAYFSQGQNTLSISTENMHNAHYFIRMITADGALNTTRFVVR